jgi:AGCS family alanine or glycine:cation symporter
MEAIESAIKAISGVIWGPYFLIPLLLGTGIFLTVRLLFINVKGFPHAIGLISGKYDNPLDPGEITHFQALSAALSATVGIGNIAGVALAIRLGGPGALFWMWVTAFFGMTLKYSSILLSHKFRVIHPDGSSSGGPMYHIEKGLGRRWKFLAVMFAICTPIAALGAGNMCQSNTIADALKKGVGIPPVVTGLFLAFMLGLIIIGGIRRIAQVTSRLAPTMCIIYVIGALTVIGVNYHRIPDAITTIITNAFTGTAAVGGFAGASFLMVLRWGVARGLFSNEAGLGSAPIAHAAAKTKESVREGLVGMIGPVVDTLIICTMTGLVIVITNTWQIKEVGVEVTAMGFHKGLRFLLDPIGISGRAIVTLGVLLFGFSTAITWSYYGDRCIMYLFGAKAVMPYRYIFVVVYFLGAIFTIRLVWNFADVANGLMAIPNLISLILLNSLIAKLTAEYFYRRKIEVGKK